MIGHGACVDSIHPVAVEQRIERFRSRSGLRLRFMFRLSLWQRLHRQLG
jgi:hypothetical protein